MAFGEWFSIFERVSASLFASVSTMRKWGVLRQGAANAITVNPERLCQLSALNRCFGNRWFNYTGVWAYGPYLMFGLCGDESDDDPRVIEIIKTIRLAWKGVLGYEMLVHAYKDEFKKFDKELIWNRVVFFREGVGLLENNGWRRTGDFHSYYGRAARGILQSEGIENLLRFMAECPKTGKKQEGKRASTTGAGIRKGRNHISQH